MRTIAFDISTTAIGWAVDKLSPVIGAGAVDFGQEVRDKSEDDTEGDIYAWVFRVVSGLAIAYDVKKAIIEESNSRINMGTTRLLLGARAIAHFALYRQTIKVEMMTCTRARKSVGITQGFPKGTTKYMRRKELKKRVIDWAKGEGFNVDSDDAADALCLLLA